MDASDESARLGEPAASLPPKVAWLHTRAARAVYYLALLGAVLAVNRVFHFGHAMAEPRKAAPALLLLWLLGLVVLLFALALYTYEDLRWRGELRRRSGLFEKILDRGK